MTIEDEFKKAKTLAFQFLKVRNRSEKEVRAQLLKKKISGKVIEQTVFHLKKIALINDRQFARDWIAMRLQRPWGRWRIFFELKQKGVSDEILEEEITAGPRPESEERIVEMLARKRLERYKNLDETKQKRRVFEYLARRGFDVDMITKVIESLCHCEEPACRQAGVSQRRSNPN